jgi:hypothetical protein
MTIELDDWDKDWLARSHSEAEYRAKVKELMERCAEYGAELEQLRGQRSRCGYPSCVDKNGWCARLFAGECSGPKQERTTI